MITRGTSPRPAVAAVIRIGAGGSAANHHLQAKRLPFMLFKMLTVVNEEDDVPRRNSEHGEEPDERAD